MSRVLCVCSDMIFATRISATAAALGREVVVLREPQQLDEHLQAGPAAVIIDLAASGPDPIGVIERLRRRPDPPPVLAYGSHVDTELAAAARAAGADPVLPRSRFSGNLPDILAAL